MFRFCIFPATLAQKSFFKKGKLTMSLNRAEALKLLDVEEKATQEQIRAAYKKLALAVHPDKNQGDLKASQEFAKLHKAYRTLSQNFTKTENASPSTALAKAKTKPHYVADPEFKLNAFWERFDELALDDEEEELKQYFLTNKTNIQATLNSIYPITERLISKSISPFLCELVTEFDFEWLSHLEDFKTDVVFLGGFLSELPLHYWEPFFNHIGHEWLQEAVEHLGLSRPRNIFSYLGSPEKTYRYEMQYAFFDVLTLDWLRQKFSNAYTLSGFLNYGARSFIDDDICHPLLIYLNGNDKWLQRTITGGTELGKVFNGMGQPSYNNWQSSAWNFIPALDSDALRKWDAFLNTFFDENWITTIVNDFDQLNAFLKNLDNNVNDDKKRNPEYTKKVVLFLENYLDTTKFSNLDHFISVLAPEQKVNETDELSANKSFAFIQAFDEKQIHDCFFNNRTLDQVLVTIESHKDKPCYTALLYATTRAYHYERELDTTPDTTLKYTRQQKLDAAQSLMKSILEYGPIEWGATGIRWGRLGQITECYRKLHSPSIKDAIMSGLLTFSSAVTSVPKLLTNNATLAIENKGP